MLPFKHTACRELSTELLDQHEWHPSLLRSISFLLDISALAVDPVARLLAVGTSSGSVRILGGAAVDVAFDNGAGIKFLQFSISLFKLVCVDNHDRLRVWDLDTDGPPKLEASTSFNHPINGITTSPSHSHVLIALRSGELRAYDLLTLRWSPHPAPNLWTAYETKMMATGALTTSRSQSKEAIDVLIHPRDLGTILVAYEGGVILCDLATHAMTRAYELDLPPGAPGGGGYPSSKLLTHRRPSVTAITMHPSGHLFCVGHVDGSITFWAIEDEDKPLLCMTLDDMDVNVVDGVKVQDGANNMQSPREPIFKLAWCGFPNSSDPRGGKTALLVLGGTVADEGYGVYTLWLPALNLPEPPVTPGQQGLHHQVREAMRKLVIPSKHYFYSTAGPVQDFLLIPSSNPHFFGNWDPVALLLLFEAEAGTRALDARQFPPPELAAGSHVPTSPRHQQASQPGDLDQELADTLQSMELYAEPSHLWLSPPLWSGKNAPLHPELVKLERDPYHKLTTEGFPADPLGLDGGIAFLDRAEDTKLIKFQAHRILVTHHRDLTVKFQGLDANLLLSVDSPIKSSFPRPLPQLTIDVMSLLADPAVSKNFAPEYLIKAHIAHVQIASESLECVVALESGEAVVYKLRSAFNDDEASRYWETPHAELVCLQHLSSLASPKYYPSLMLNTGRGRVTAMAMSDIGFLAVAYKDGSLFVCDMRGPSLILRHVPLGRSGSRHRLSIHHKPEGKDNITSLSWTVCGIKKDLTPRIRLLAVYNSGSAHVYTIDRPNVSSNFAVLPNHETTEGVPSPFPDQDSSVVLDSKTGLRYKADSHGLMTAMNPDNITGAGRSERHYVWVVAGEKGARATLDLTGERLGRVEWGNKAGSVIKVRIVERTDTSALVAFTDRCQALVYSLPQLDHMHTWDLPYSHPTAPLIAADTTGDYVLSALHPRTPLIMDGVYGTLFSQRRGFYGLPRVDLGAKRTAVPPQPQPVSLGPASVLGSLMSYIGKQSTMTGEEVDALLAGRDRPAPKKPARRALSSQRAPSPGASAADGSALPNVNALSQQISQGATAVFGRVSNALAERGEMLDSLQDQVQSLEQGSRNMVNQAKIAAAKQTAKGWFSFGGGL